MPTKVSRKPIGNFFIKKQLQVRLITKIVMAVLLSTLIFAGVLAVTYHFTYRDAAFYQVTLSRTEPEIGDRLNIIAIILPSLLISAVVNIVIAFGVGLYASRKYAVPIYKLEQWSNLLRQGRLSAKLLFREKQEMEDLINGCNEFTEELRDRLLKVKRAAHALQKRDPDSQELRTVVGILDTLELESQPIEVHTSFMDRQDIPSPAENKKVN